MFNISKLPAGTPFALNFDFGGHMLKHFFSAALIALGLSSQAMAEVIKTTGDVAEVAFPVNFYYTDEGDFHGDSTISQSEVATVFSERTNFVIPHFDTGFLAYEPAGAGAYAFTGLTRIFPVGAKINSYILHFGTVGNVQGQARGTITFNKPIIGFNTYFNDISAEYEYEKNWVSLIGSTGLELGDADPFTTIGDFLSISQDRKTLTFSLNVNSRTDDLRIYTAVPEPASLSLFGLALFGIGMSRLRKRG